MDLKGRLREFGKRYGFIPRTREDGSAFERIMDSGDAKRSQSGHGPF